MRLMHTLFLFETRAATMGNPATHFFGGLSGCTLLLQLQVHGLLNSTRGGFFEKQARLERGGGVS